MAYLRKEKCKSIRDNLKKRFPEFKFSVVNENHSLANVTIVSGPISFDPAKERNDIYGDPLPLSLTHGINHYYPDNYTNADVLREMIDIIMDGNHDRSDSMTDYFDVGWYVTMNQGTWDKPYILTEGAK